MINTHEDNSINLNEDQNDTNDQNEEEECDENDVECNANAMNYALDSLINEELDVIFHEIDVNYNGKISAIELEEYLNKLGKKGWVNCDDIDQDKKEGLDDCKQDGKGWVDKREYYINAMWGDVDRTEEIDKEHFRK